MLRGSELSVQYLSSYALTQNNDFYYLYAPLIPVVLLSAKDLHQDQRLSVPGALHKANEEESLPQKDGEKKTVTCLAQAYTKDVLQKKEPNSHLNPDNSYPVQTVLS